MVELASHISLGILIGTMVALIWMMQRLSSQFREMITGYHDVTIRLNRVQDDWERTRELMHDHHQTIQNKSKQYEETMKKLNASHNSIAEQLISMNDRIENHQLALSGMTSQLNKTSPFPANPWPTAKGKG